MRRVCAGLVVVIALGALFASQQITGPSDAASLRAGLPDRTPLGIHKIRHVVIIMQENRSFDEYFGTYPGAAGIPMSNGTPTVCVPDPATRTCVKPYHDTSDDTTTNGGPHGTAGARGDIDGGKMDGFIAQAEQCTTCGSNPDSVMGYHTTGEIPNYWAYA